MSSSPEKPGAEESWKIPIEIDGESIEITLRPMKNADMEDFDEWSREKEVNRFCSPAAYIGKYNDYFDFSQYMTTPKPWFRVISMNEKAIGFINVNPNSGLDDCRADLAYALDYKYWGKGIVTLAIKIVVSKIFLEWPLLQRLEAMVEIENKGSQRVLEKVGFMKEGVLRKYSIRDGLARDFVMFSLLNTNVLLS